MALPHDLRDRELRSFVEVPVALQGQPDNPTARQVILVDSQGNPLAEVGGALTVSQGQAAFGPGAWPVFLVDAIGNRVYPTANAVLADATANPTLAGEAVFPLIFNGTTWDRQREVVGDTQAAAGIAAVGPMLFNGTNYDRVREVAAADAQAPAGFAAAAPLLFNGTNWDRQRGNEDRGAVITAVSATTGATSADIVNYNARGIIVTLQITAGTLLSVTPVIKAKDAATGTYTTLLTGAAQTTISATALTVYPGAVVTANVSASSPVPRVFQVSTTHGNTTPCSYVVGVNLIV